ncbi:hypothetical protein KFK09_019404 [Dendrobium nobile]|uniref:Uncharacterized protein n=1 Tax=Dendrobium nobile TaxID=94219 RepID=A0A8T3APE7_DENNO|nr:hypothetical protein KFK09_019404 [Dendrobium nobile]
MVMRKMVSRKEKKARRWPEFPPLETAATEADGGGEWGLISSGSDPAESRAARLWTEERRVGERSRRKARALASRYDLPFPFSFLLFPLCAL